MRIFFITLLTVALMSAAAYGTGVAVKHFGEEDTVPASSPQDVPSEPSDAPTSESTPDAEPTEDPAPSEEPTETEAPEPEPVLSPGDTGEQVRELQHRLFQTAWLPETTTGTYDDATTAAVKGFQEKRDFEATGIVDQQTWDKLVEMTETPTHDQMFNVLKPGPKLLGEGDTGDKVRDLQARLKQIAWYSGSVTDTYGPETTAAVKGFQEKRKIPATGEVDQRTMDRLLAMTRKPTHNELHNIIPKTGKNTDAPLDERCLSGRVLCIDKTSNSLRWVVDGQVLTAFDVRFGSAEMPTREGAFKVNSKSRNHVSSIYHTSMPFAMFFSGGQAVHYSPDFAARGYNGASHGCVNVRDRAGIEALFDQVKVGDKVIVYRS
ncbi:peptidoglycan-binding protein [Nocardioides sp. AE5]|uniref:L,D-transpeptidase family protein n=1 Tax=Nocardioides sp. AE5 TaxID=2962573 RepID=UPI0028822E9E|nr:peptidoglycan-binding protein [Nocardioides sp. AE5]MDT0200689.1 peptidoglycan-binding protein [Nocardioides sp. AE5]